MLRRRLIALVCAWALLWLYAPALASQNTLQMPTSGTVSGLQFSNDVTDALDSLATCNSGTSAPVNAAGGSPKAGQCWIDTTSSTLLKKYVYSGSAWLLTGVLDVTNGIWSPPIGGGTATVASAATTSICGSPQGYLVVSGTTSIGSFGTGCPAGQVKVLLFSGILTLTYNSTSMILPGGVSYLTAVGDIAVAVSEGSGNWRLVIFPASGQAVANPAVPVCSTIDYIGGNVPAKYVLPIGQALPRASYPDYLACATVAQSGIRTSGSGVITGLGATDQFGVGMPVEGAGIPAGATIASVDSSTQITLSANATSGGTSTVTVFLYGYGGGGDSTTVGVPDLRGVVIAGRDNMLNTARNKLTSTYFGANPDALGATGGSDNHQLVVGELPAFTPSGSVSTSVGITDGRSYGIPAQPSGGAGSGSATLQAGGGPARYINANVTGSITASASSSFSGNTIGSGQHHSIVQPTFIANKLIRVLP